MGDLNLDRFLGVLTMLSSTTTLLLCYRVEQNQYHTMRPAQSWAIFFGLDLVYIRSVPLFAFAFLGSDLGFFGLISGFFSTLSFWEVLSHNINL